MAMAMAMAKILRQRTQIKPIADVLMAIANPPRLIAISIASLTLAAALGAQAVSSVLTRKQPALAVAAFPANGLAREALAFQNFSVAVAQEAEPAVAAAANADQALLGIKTDPLAPKAYAILASASEDEGVRSEILDAASQLNRRDLNLQSLVLKKHLDAQDYAKTIDTLDQILRVHPSYSPEFFPVLAGALANQETVPLFADILDGSSAWHLRFLKFATRQRNALASLALLRPQISSADTDFDKRLVAALAAQGDIQGAASVYELSAPADKPGLPKGQLDWSGEFPPFDWQFVDESGFRAQPSRDGDELELFVRPGKGGVIAARLLQAPDGPFAIRIKHDIKPAHLREDASLVLSCTNGAAPILTQTLDAEANTFQVPALPQDCEYVILAINARAWTGRSALHGTIKQISVLTGASAGN